MSCFTLAVGSSLYISIACGKQKSELINAIFKFDWFTLTNLKIRLNYKVLHTKLTRLLIGLSLFYFTAHTIALKKAYVKSLSKFIYLFICLILNTIVLSNFVQAFVFMSAIRNRLNLLRNELGIHKQFLSKGINFFHLKHSVIELFDINKLVEKLLRSNVLINMVEVNFSILCCLYWLGMLVLGSRSSSIYGLFLG